MTNRVIYVLFLRADLSLRTANRLPTSQLLCTSSRHHRITSHNLYEITLFLPQATISTHKIFGRTRIGLHLYHWRAIVRSVGRGPDFPPNEPPHHPPKSHHPPVPLPTVLTVRTSRQFCIAIFAPPYRIHSHFLIVSSFLIQSFSGRINPGPVCGTFLYLPTHLGTNCKTVLLHLASQSSVASFCFFEFPSCSPKIHTCCPSIKSPRVIFDFAKQSWTIT